MKVYELNIARKRKGLAPILPATQLSDTDKQILAIREYLDKLTATVVDLDREQQELRRDYSLLITRIRILARKEGDPQ